MGKPKVLFILHLPPPVHGAAMMGQYIRDSKAINEAFDCRFLNLASSQGLADIGKASLKKIGDVWRLLKNVRKALKEFKPDLVYITPNAKGVAFYKDYLVVQLVKRHAKNIVAHYHNKGVATRQEKVLDNLLYKRFFKGFKVILLANTLYKDVEKYVSKDNVYICHNGIAESHAERHARPNNEVPSLLFLSNLIVAKGVYTLLDACKALTEKHIDFACTYVGAESYDVSKQDLEEAIRTRGLEKCVRYAGQKYGDEKDAFFNRADIFIFPTHSECFPLTILEAMQHALPIIASDEGAISEMIDNGVTGWIVPKKDAKALAEKIEYAIGHPDECRKMGEAGYQRYLQHYTLETFENRLKDILQDCIEKA